jgi:NADH-quinone oxidoreductase subunit C
VAGSTSRFQVIARLQKPGTALGVHLKTDLPEDDLSLDTWVDLFRGANWHEREAWEMFGVDFVGHPALRHIYLPTEFEGNPLRKDYPLLARVVKPWPGVVDIEEIPAGLEEQLEAEVMAAFEAEQAGGGGS